MKLPVAYTLGNREASTDKDAVMRNAVAEVDEQSQVVRARKRPGIVGAFTTTVGVGQTIFTWNTPGDVDSEEELVTITDDTVTTGASIIPINNLFSFTVQPS